MTGILENYSEAFPPGLTADDYDPQRLAIMRQQLEKDFKPMDDASPRNDNSWNVSIGDMVCLKSDYDGNHETLWMTVMAAQKDDETGIVTLTCIWRWEGTFFHQAFDARLLKPRA